MSLIKNKFPFNSFYGEFIADKNNGNCQEKVRSLVQYFTRSYNCNMTQITFHKKFTCKTPAE